MATAIYKTKDGTCVPGVTTVLGVINKPFLVTWANNLGLQGINCRAYVDELATIGTLAHYLVECNVKGCDPYLGNYTPEQVEQAQKCFTKWLEWRGNREIIPILQESPLVNEQHRYGGTIDLYVRIDGVPTLIDIKTAKAIYSEQRAQVTAYRYLLRDNGCPVDRAQIVRIGRNEDEAFEVAEVTDETGAQWQIFQHALEIYRLQKEVKW